MSEMHGPVRVGFEFTFPDSERAQSALPDLSAALSATAGLAGATLITHELMPLLQEVDPDSELSSRALPETDFERALNPAIDLFAPEIQAKLDTPLAEAFCQPQPDDRRPWRYDRVLRLLNDNGLQTVRDVYVEGSNMGIRDFGETSISWMHSELSAYLPEVPLVEYALPEDAVYFCTLDQIHIRAATFLLLDDEEVALRRITIGEMLANSYDYSAFPALAHVVDEGWYTEYVVPEIRTYVQRFEDACAYSEVRRK